MGWTTDVEAALGEHLADLGLGVWRASGVYAATETGIVVESVPPSPDRVITITAYVVSQSATSSDLILGLQIRCRGTRDPRVATDTADAVFEALHNARDLTLGQAVCALVWRQTHANLGPDANGRYETSSNFYAHTAHGSQHTED